MGKIVISENVTLDGVIQDPTGDEGFRSGGWFVPATAPDGGAWAAAGLEEARGTQALLMGRRTYEYFVKRGWQSRTGEWAERLRSVPKYVVSSTLGDLEWSNSTVLKGEVIDEVSHLRRTVNGDIVVHASGRLVHTLMEHDLFDELRLTIHPVVLGTGARLFDQTSGTKPLRLVGTHPIGAGLTHVTYQPAQHA